MSWFRETPESMRLLEEERAKLAEQEADWLAHAKPKLQRGECPYSGLRLHENGEGDPGSLSCDVCDCFGFSRDEVGA
ncbi:hypothetical protein [Mycolicibacterium fortuitum]|uniref:Uncharacterized protein n=1 Tax=Mycolicibacterium fortuitum TaxID=1766 RepID=A0AAE4V726_MYCFO|nr:hypothetical protein [Mycolicibacterium fortuitum]MCA4754802.1 hypothetical protein [Mycolicibacterium fortuitum]MDG5773934.1 hypothetical protein [Mycolicibacterium fortuitum]MDG5779680.1 hypothetical protein [Mycolicibacterium fortuitum]MDV7194629.1 hypothetical protein [Mycolicibacterium fortuitum]MDV7208629.1 hypothetical protein [Mycolicibacterium fortuitum]